MYIPDVAEHLLTFKKKYQLTKKQWQPLESSINHLLTRHQDKSLYLGVAGEFSSGKSTLINALLGHHLLKEDVIQGTTCAPTFLRYGRTFDVVIEYTNRPIQILSETAEYREIYAKILKWFQRVEQSKDKGTIQIPDEFAAIQQFIDKHTADEQTAKNIVRTTIYLNNLLLQSGVVIVDTPGINANSRHSAVAENAIKEYCDAVLLLVPSSNPCSEVLCKFVRNHLQGIQCSSVAILTKADMIRPREINRTLNFVKTRLESETDTSFADVLSCAAFYSLNFDPDAKISLEKQEEFRAQFQEMVQKIIAYLDTSRNIIITRKLTQVLQSLIPQIRKHVHEKQNQYNQKVTALQNNQLKNLDAYIANSKAEFTTQFNYIYIADTQYENYVQQELFDWIDYETSQAESVETLKEIANIFSEAINGAWNYVCENLDGDCQEFYDRTKDFCKRFLKDFNKEYRNLSRNYSRTIQSSTTLQDVQQIQIQEFSQSLELVNEFEAVETVLVGGGMLAGAALGTFLIPIPVVGTAIGGVLGTVVGALFANQEEENQKMAATLKSEYLTKVKPKIQELVSSRIESHRKAAKRSMVKWFDSLVQQYGNQITQLINMEQEEQAKLKKKLEEAKQDLVRLESWEKGTENNL